MLPGRGGRANHITMNISTGSPGPPLVARKLIIAMAILMLLSALFLVPGSPAGVAEPWFWFAVVFFFLLLWSLFAAARPPEQRALEEPHVLTPEEQPAVVREIMD